MSIEATCGECARHYTLKDEFSGKKIRCKSCSAVITVPTAKKSVKKSDDDFPLDDDLFGGSDDGFDEEPDYPRRPAKKPSRDKASPARKRKRKSADSGNPFGLIVKILGGIFACSLAFFIASNVVRAVLAGATWKPYDVPNAPGCTIEMPKAPQHKLDPQGNPTIFAEISGYACAALSESLDPQVQFVFADLNSNLGIIEKGLKITMPQSTFQSARVVTMNGIPAADFTLMVKDIIVVKRAFIANGRVITLDFASKKPRPVEMERYFGSFKVAGGIAPASNQPNPSPALPSNTAPVNALPERPLPTLPTSPPAVAPAGPPVTVETPANMLVPDTPVDPSAPPNVRRTAWRYVDAPIVLEGQTSNAGVFLKKLGDNWVEQRKKASTTYWNETARTADYIEIMRTDRSMFVRLFNDKSEYRLGSESEFKSLYPGKWE